MTALALAMWLAFHFLLTRRTARLVRAAEQLAAGNLAARSGLSGTDELGRLSRAFDAMALKVADTQTRLQQDIADRKRSAEGAAGIRGKLPRDLRRRRGRDFRARRRSGAIVDVNPKACSTFGYSREEFRALDVGTLGTGERRSHHEAALGLIARAFAGEQLRVEWHGKSKDGTLRWHEVFVKRVTIGGHDRILALARDITGRKAAEAALRASEEQYHAMFNASIDGLALWNAAGEIVDTNPALWQMYGYGDGEYSALPPGTWTGPSYQSSIPARGRGGRIAAHGGAAQRRKDGTALELEVHGIPMQYQGKPHVLTITRDITEKKRSAEELARQRESLVPAREARRTRLTAGRRLARAQQSAVGRRRARRAARGARRLRNAGRRGEDPHGGRALRAHRAHVPRDGAPAAAASAGRSRSTTSSRRRSTSPATRYARAASK